MTGGVYVILNRENGNRYIGSTVDFASRWKAHRIALRRARHGNRHLQSAWKKYGEDCFSFSVLLICAREHRLFYEQLAIDELKPEYNIAPVAGSALGMSRSSEVREKIAHSMRGNKNALGAKKTEKERQDIGERSRKRTGWRHSEEFRDLASQRMIGNQFAKGTKHGPEFRAKRSEYMKALWAARRSVAA